MPQMAPLNWLLLFIVFIFIFLLFNSMNFFLSTYSPRHKSHTKLTKTINWKW
uniref:ATP synthase complex subunit 8 n=2 Tax=unclassified Hybosorus TaxID=2644960 RepID=A0A0S2MRL0_9SCAR|nr:ATP synthase F0 subunit 8 [Hybosorus sp. HYB02]ALO77316.1 ATP synthase F0 subunit 8 [Hybosorus sp. HYB01]